MQNSSELHNLIATALTGIVKQIKAIRYYPPKHPALQAAAAENLRGFKPVLANSQQLSLTVRKEGFLYDDSPVAKGNQVLGQLASFCFARRIQFLTFLTDLNSSDLYHFVHYLLLDPQIIQKQGGMQVILEKARLKTIWTNIRDLDDILQRRKEIEALPEDPDFDPAAVLSEGEEPEEASPQVDTITLETLIARMEQEKNDASFQHSTQELIPLLRRQLVTTSRTLVLRAILLLCRCATGKQYSQERRQNAIQALDQLATEEMTDYLAAYLFASENDLKVRDTLLKVMVFLGSKVAPRLMALLIDEETASNRKTLCEALVRCNTKALPVVYEYLNADLWYVVRNAVAILGNIRNQESLEQLPPLLEHDEIRVRRETVRALTKIGGKRAINILLQVAVSNDYEMSRQAILSLGAMRADHATPVLLSLLKKKDWSQRTVDLKKDTIRSLGEIRAPEAIPELVKIIKKKRWLRRQLNNELRIAAATALGDVAEESTRAVLDKATHDRNASVARAAAQALKQLDKVIT